MCAWRRLASRLKYNLKSFHPRRWLTHGALALIAGVLLGLRVEAAVVWPLMIFVSALLAVLLHAEKYAVYPAVLLCFFFAGMTVCSYRSHPVLPPEGKYQICATAVGEGKIREEDTRIAIYLKDIVLQSEAGETYYLDSAYWTYWPEEEDPLPPYDGQQVVFAGKLYQPSGQENPYGFDFRMYLLQKGVTAGISGGSDLLKLPEGQTQHKSVLLRIRRAICDRLKALLGDQSPLAEALLIGHTEDMPENMREDFRRAGVAHVLSVSGLHAMLIMGFVIKLLEKCQASPRVVLCVTGVLLVIYTALVGAGTPILRAAVLVIYQMYAHVARRRADPLSALSLGVIVILLLQPLELFAAGFQMSFGAVLGMIMLGDAVKPWLLRIRSRKIYRILSAYSVTLCATLGVLLPLIYTYNSVSLIGLLINPLVCAMTEIIMLFDIGLLLISVISLPLAQEMGTVAAHLSRFMVEGVGLAGSVNGAGMHVFSPPWHLAAAIALCLILCTRFVKMKKPVRLLLGGTAMIASCAVMLLTQNRDVRYMQLALGDADAAVIEDKRETIIIDTGEYGGDLSSYLLSTGRRADHLILSHLHADHALGLEELLKEDIPIGTLYLTTEALKTAASVSVMDLLEAAEQKGVPMKYISAGDVIETGRVKISVLWPEEGSGHALKNPNDSAAALLIDLDGTYLLHMSDVPGTYEQYVGRPADILKAAHHGSQDSTHEDFLMLTNPRVCLISGNNPHEKTLSRLANVGAMVYDSDTCGAITVTVHEGQYFIEGYLQ